MKPSKTLLLAASFAGGLTFLALAQPAPTNADKNGADTNVVCVVTNAQGQLVTNTVAAPTATPNGELRLNFRGAPLDLVLSYLSEAAGFIINQTTDVHGTVDVWSKQPVTKDEAVELLASVLKKNGYALTRNGRILTILPLDSAKTSSELPVVSGSNPEEVSKSDEIETRIIPVHYANATQLVPNLEMLLPTTATLSANESANSLILVATKSDIKRMLEVIQALDTSIASVSSIKVIPLRYADAKETATMITQLFSPQNNQNNGGNRGNMFSFGGRFSMFRAMAGGGFPGGGGGGGSSGSGGAAAKNVVAVADERSNSLVVCAPADLLTTIQAMIQEIDQQVSDLTELRVFRLRNADPTELADQLSALFPSDTSNSNNNQQNVPFFMRFGGRSQAPASNESDRAKRLGNVLAVADPRTASIIVTASKTMMPQIADMIAELDSEKGKKEVVSYYELQNADPQDVYQNLEDLFNRSTVHMQNNNSRNSLIGQNNPLTLRETTGNRQPTIGSTMTRTGTGNGAGGVGALGR